VSGTFKTIMRRVAILFGGAIIAALAAPAGLTGRIDTALAQSDGGTAMQSASRDFAFACAPCHGRTGKGDGPVASELKVSPPDLTAIARRAGGRFPADKVYARIEGLTMPDAHGTREMPIWGAVFLFEELGGSVLTKDAKPATEQTRRRLQHLVDYLRSIQD